MDKNNTSVEIENWSKKNKYTISLEKSLKEEENKNSNNKIKYQENLKKIKKSRDFYKKAFLMIMTVAVVSLSSVAVRDNIPSKTETQSRELLSSVTVDIDKENNTFYYNMDELAKKMNLNLENQDMEFYYIIEEIMNEKSLDDELKLKNINELINKLKFEDNKKYTSLDEYLLDKNYLNDLGNPSLEEYRKVYGDIVKPLAKHGRTK